MYYYYIALAGLVSLTLLENKIKDDRLRMVKDAWGIYTVLQGIEELVINAC